MPNTGKSILIISVNLTTTKLTRDFSSSPVQSSPVQSSPVQSSPVQSSPVQSSPVQSSPVQSSPVQSSPVQSSPVQLNPEAGYLNYGLHPKHLVIFINKELSRMCWTMLKFNWTANPIFVLDGKIYTLKQPGVVPYINPTIKLRSILFVGSAEPFNFRSFYWFDARKTFRLKPVIDHY